MLCGFVQKRCAGPDNPSADVDNIAGQAQSLAPRGVHDDCRLVDQNPRARSKRPTHESARNHNTEGVINMNVHRGK